LKGHGTLTPCPSLHSQIEEHYEEFYRDTAKKEFIPFEIFEIRGKVNRDLGKPLAAIPSLDLAEKSLGKAESITPR
jgi:hypothetical protein